LEFLDSRVHITLLKDIINEMGLALHDMESKKMEIVLLSSNQGAVEVEEEDEEEAHERARSVKEEMEIIHEEHPKIEESIIPWMVVGIEDEHETTSFGIIMIIHLELNSDLGKIHNRTTLSRQLKRWLESLGIQTIRAVFLFEKFGDGDTLLETFFGAIEITLGSLIIRREIFDFFLAFEDLIERIDDVLLLTNETSVAQKLEPIFKFITDKLSMFRFGDCPV